METISAKAVKFGDDVNTDVILPGKYLPLIDPKELGQHAMEGLDPAFTKKAKDGIILVAGKNFGCGSSREQAPIALKGTSLSGTQLPPFILEILSDGGLIENLRKRVKKK